MGRNGSKPGSETMALRVRFPHPLRDLYAGHVRDAGLRRNLNIIIAAAATGMVFFSTIGGAPMTGLAEYLGAGDFVFGLLWALPVLATLFQLAASALLEKTGKSKKIFLIAGVIQRGIWLIVGLLPVVIPDVVAGWRIWALISIVAMSAVAGSFVNVTFFSFFSTLVPMEIRGRYISLRAAACTFCSAVGGLGVAYVLDTLPGYTGFSIVFTATAILGVADILWFIPAKLPPHRPAAAYGGILGGISAILSEKRTRSYFMFWVAYMFSLQIGSVFFTRFAIEVQQLTYVQIILFGQIVCNALTMVFLPKWGRFLDRYGSRPLLMITGTFTSVFVLVWLPAGPGMIWPMLVFNLVGGIVWCGTDITSQSMLLSHTKEELRSLSVALYAGLTAIASAAAFLAAGLILQYTRPVFDAREIFFLGARFDQYKLLFIVTTLARLLSTWLLVPRIWNEKDYTFRDVIKDVCLRLRMRRAASRANPRPLRVPWRKR
jgi:MFS family permease